MTTIQERQKARYQAALNTKLSWHQKEVLVDLFTEYLGVKKHEAWEVANNFYNSDRLAFTQSLFNNNIQTALAVYDKVAGRKA